MQQLFPLLALVLSTLLPLSAQSEPSLAQFGAGDGPEQLPDGYRLLDAASTFGQSNAIAFPLEQAGLFVEKQIRAKLHVTKGGDGGAILLLNCDHYGKRGPAPFVKSWTEPNLTKSFAVGIDVHNPPNREPFGPWGNYQGLPEREISLHWDGREIIKRVSPVEFRGIEISFEIMIQHVIGGAEVSVRIGEQLVYDRFFIAELLPYPARLAIGAATRHDAAMQFDVKGLEFKQATPTAAPRPPLHFEVFHHVMTDNSKTAYESTVTLPPLEWALGRVILTLDIHDAGKMWDEWDRNGEVSLWDRSGRKLGIVPFITSYRTVCHWKVDISHFRPYLTGDVKFEISAGTTFYKNRGYAMSVGLDFYHGAPEHEPFEVIPLWHGTARYKSAKNHFRDFFQDRTVQFPGDVTHVRIFTTTTGHSQIGEFTPSKRTIEFLPADSPSPLRFENTLWKSDCYLNPNRPQLGTWKYSRAGWAPGDVVHPWWIDLTKHLRPGSTATLKYLPQPYDFGNSEQKPTDGQINQASHVVRSYLILSRKPNATVPAPIVRVTKVVKNSNADRAGIKRGDYLARYDGVLLDSVEDLKSALGAAAKAGRNEVLVEVYRGSDKLEIKMPAGKLGVHLSDR